MRGETKMNIQILSKATCRVLFAAAVATTATFAANAASRYWTGADDTIWNNTANWEDGNFPGNDEVYFQNNKFDSKFTGESGSVITFTNSFSVWRTRLRGAGSEQVPLVLRAADSESGLDFGTSVGIIVADSSGSGYLRIESGTYPISAGIRIGENATYYGQLTVTGGAVLQAKNGNMEIQNGKVILDNGTIEISKTDKYVSLGNQADGCELHLENGGVLTTSLIWDGNKGKTSTVLFNGGTLKANGVFSTLWPAIIADKANITVNVGANGGTIDASGFNIQVARPIAAEGANDGGMTFKGGGSVSLKYASTYTGATKVELGTKIIATTADAKASVLANLVVTGVAADGDYYVFECSGLTDNDLANVTCPGGAEGTTITRDGNQIKVHYVAPAEGLGWNGGDAAWATANAWTNATGTAKTWTDGNYAVFEDASTITLGANAAAVSATFNADATVAAGGGTLTVPAVTVSAGVSATIAAPTAGALEKTGAGTLTLGSSRTDATTLSEGTLVANAPIGTLVFGTDYPVTFDYCGQTLSTMPASAVGGGDVTLKNGTFGSSINVNMNSGSLRVEGDSTVVNCNEFNVGPSDGSSSASYVQIGGMFNAGWHFRDRCGDFIMTNVTITASKNYEVGSSAAATRGRMILSGGSASIVGNFNVFNGELEIMNETVEVAGSVHMGSNGNSGLITLKSGGTLTTKVIQKYGTPASATVLFDGGTLKANAENINGLVRNEAILSIQTSANGGTIDAAGYAVTVHREIENKSGESGAMTYKGGGKVTLTAQPTYTGITTVEVGTTLVIPEAIAGDMVFSVPGELADGIYTVVSISGESQFEDDVLSDKAEGFVLSSDKRKICYVKGTGVDTTKPIYIGTDGNLSAAGNWLDDTVPTGGTGDAQIFCASATTLTVGDTFAPAKLIISDGSALVTIGSGTLCVGEIENRQLLAVGTGATVVIGNQLTLAKGESLCDHNYGTLVVSNLLLKAESGDRYLTENQAASASGVFKFGTVTNSMTDNWLHMVDHNGAVTPYEFYIGAGGLDFLNASGSAGYSLGLNTGGNSSTTIRPWYSDFTIADRGTGNRSLILQHDITFCTDDESGEGRTITIDANTRGQRSPVITVSGKGTLQVNGTCENSAEPVVTVTDTATLAFGEGASIGTGAITLGAGTTLALTATSREFAPLANTLNLPTGENEKATIRIDGEPLRSGDHEIATVGNEATTANVTLAPASEALDGRKGTLRVENGKLKLNVQPGGLTVIIR